jgi:hypothetical protein
MPSLRRGPPASVLTWDGERLHIDTRSWLDEEDGLTTGPEEALEPFNASVAGRVS